MALSLATSLVECQAFDPADQMRRYVWWWREGTLSSTGRCFDIGNTVRAALQRFERTGDPYSGSAAPNTAGNGSLMRLVPVPLAFAGDPEQAVQHAGAMSRTNHAAPTAVDACRLYAGLILGALQGLPKDVLLDPAYAPVPGLWEREPLVEPIATIGQGSYTRRTPPQIRGTGYVVDALEAALWAFWTTEDFRSGALAAVNLGDDADTTGAIYGQLAGAYYGVDGIPPAWVDAITDRQHIEELGDGLLMLSGR